MRGRLWFDVWVLGIAANGSRRVDFTASIEDIVVDPVAGEDADKWRIRQGFRHTISAGQSDPNAEVTEPARTARDELLGSWDSEPSWTLTYTSPDKGPLYEQGNAQRVWTTIGMDISATSPTASSYHDIGAFTSQTRFDYAGPTAGKHKGTVFANAKITFHVDLNNPKQNESSLHIDDALHHPERTFPALLGKSLPGENEPLHRLTDREQIDANREKSIATCRDVWGSYNGEVLNCDEYPFASTYEGSSATDVKNRFSVRLIDRNDNQHVGRDLLNNGFYTVHRVLDGDAFYVLWTVVVDVRMSSKQAVI